MGRSVATHPDAVEIVYLQPEIEDEGDWDGFLEDVSNRIIDRYPSFRQTQEWDTNELRRFLQSDHAYVTISDYCGVVAVCLCSRTGPLHPNIADHWLAQIGSGFRKLFAEAFPDSFLTPMGRAGNGEMFYQRPDGRTVVERGEVL